MFVKATPPSTDAASPVASGSPFASADPPVTNASTGPTGDAGTSADCPVPITDGEQVDVMGAGARRERGSDLGRGARRATGKHMDEVGGGIRSARGGGRRGGLRRHVDGLAGCQEVGVDAGRDDDAARAPR